jgi:hypothetical protein
LLYLATMRATQFLTTALIVFATACTGSEDSSASQRNLEEEGDCGCKIEGDLIGQEWVLVRFNAKGVAVHDWVEKPGSNGEYLGFTLTTNASSIKYTVKAATVRYDSTTMTWSHPGGDGANAISNVDFCDNCEGGDCDGDGGCDNPDGCDGGGGGGDGGGGGGDGGGTCDNPDGCDGGGDGGPILTFL